jgi:hypothetical protein
VEFSFLVIKSWGFYVKGASAAFYFGQNVTLEEMEIASL